MSDVDRVVGHDADEPVVGPDQLGAGPAIWASVLVGLICGLALVPVGFFSLLMAWGASSLAPSVLVFAVFVLLLAFGCAVVVRGAGGRAAAGALAPVVAGGLLAGWYLQADALAPGPGVAMLVTGIIGGATAAVGQPRIGTIGRLVAGAVLLSPAVVPAALSVFTTFGDFRERASAHGVPYTLAGPGYEEQYIALGEGSSVAVYQMPDGEEVHVSSTATVHDDRSTSGLTFGECRDKPFDNGETALECVANGPGFEVRLVSFGAADEADLAEAFEHLRPMSDSAFCREARRYVEVVPG